MNKDIAQGKWKQLKGIVQQQWGKLTNDELDQIDGDRERLAGKIQEKYGEKREEVEKKVDEFIKKHG